MARILLLWLTGTFFIGNALALEKVVLQLKWRHQFQFAGYYAAIAKGYYRDVGLDVELREAHPGRDPVDEVLAGRAQFGVGTSNLILLRAQGKPIVVLAAIYQHSPFVLLVTADSHISDIHSLSDHPLMMEPDAAELLAYFKSEGVDISKLQLLDHSFDALDLMQSEAVGMSAYSTDEPYRLQAAGIDYFIFNPRAGGIDFYGDNLFTTEAEIKKHPERVRAFLDASLRGWKYAMAHPEEIVDLILKEYPRGKSRDQLLFEAKETAKLLRPDLIEIGYINPGRWEDIARTYVDLGMMESEVPLDGFIYERFVQPDLRLVYWTGGGFLILALAAGGWSLATARMNKRLLAEIKARELAEQRTKSESEAKTQFLAVLAHEVRSPLSAILSSLWIYNRMESEEAKKEVVDIAATSTANLLRMVDNILDQSKIECGQMEVEYLSIDVPDFLTEITKLFRASAATKSIGLKLTISPECPPQITTDPTRLRQILSNILSNAIKFTDQGSVQLSVTVNEERTNMLFSVVDSGPGLAGEQVDKIFKAYAQADASISRSHGGTGLGLWISSELAKLLGGELSVTSTPGKGSTFMLRVPLTQDINA